MKQFTNARRAGVPLLGIETSDPAQTIEACVKSLNGKGGETPVMQWNCIQGLIPVNDAGGEAMTMEEITPEMTLNPAELFGILVTKAGRKGSKLLEAVIFIHMSNRLLDEYGPCQGVWNCRDIFKRKSIMLVLLGPSIKLPEELKHDVVVVSEPLPGDKELEAVCMNTVVTDGELPENIFTDHREKVLDTLRGLSCFAAEQVLAMSITREAGIDLDELWQRKRKMIEQTPGLEVWKGGESFADLGGLVNLKEFLTRVLTSGKTPVRAIGFIDEIEKAMGGAAGDTSGTSQDQLLTLLRVMQDKAIPGIILIGPGGTGKSAIAKAAGNVADAPVISIDLGAMKGSLVGQSEARIRSAMDVFEAVSQGKGMFIATCNKIASLPPELRRRFTLGTFFVDLPGEEERATIWKLWKKRYGASDDDTSPEDDDGWTGAEIKACCDVAYRTGLKLNEAAKFVVPVIKSAPDQVEALRKMANGRFISANKPGIYKFSGNTEDVVTSGRKLQL